MKTLKTEQVKTYSNSNLADPEVGISILVNGIPIRQYEHEGNFYVEGRKGSEYSIQIKNFYHQKILAVPSVDGLSVIDGKPASFDSDGFVVYPYQTLIIPGWFLDHQSVAKFKFSNLNKSYSKKTGQDKNNIGVIGVAIFTEKDKYTYTDWCIYESFPNSPSPTISPKNPFYVGTPISEPYYYTTTKCSFEGNINSVSSTNSYCPATFTYANNENVSDVPRDAKVQQEVGTEFGNKSGFFTEKVYFERSSNVPIILFQIHYDSKENLIKKGVINKQKINSPNPFPNAYIGCKPPKNWKE